MLIYITKSFVRKFIYFKYPIVHENQMEWYECQGNKIDQKEIVLGTIYEKNKFKIKEYIGVEN